MQRSIITARQTLKNLIYGSAVSGMVGLFVFLPLSMIAKDPSLKTVFSYLNYSIYGFVMALVGCFIWPILQYVGSLDEDGVRRKWQEILDRVNVQMSKPAIDIPWREYQKRLKLSTLESVENRIERGPVICQGSWTSDFDGITYAISDFSIRNYHAPTATKVSMSFFWEVPGNRSEQIFDLIYSPPAEFNSDLKIIAPIVRSLRTLFPGPCGVLVDTSGVFLYFILDDFQNPFGFLTDTELATLCGLLVQVLNLTNLRLAPPC